ncbi:MAG: NifU family protein [Pseudomonadota bacterium]
MLKREEVEKVLNERIKPMLAADGGGIELVDVKEDNTVVVKLTGACGCCPFSLMTLKNGVERALKQAFPELKEVIAA